MAQSMTNIEKVALDIVLSRGGSGGDKVKLPVTARTLKVREALVGGFKIELKLVWGLIMRCLTKCSGE